MAFFTIDGVQWDIPCDIERVSEVKSSSISGELLNGDYFNDVLGQYLRYTISLVVPRGEESNYSTLYNLLSNPVPEHTFVLPYNQTVISVRGRVEQVSDKYIRENSGVIWRNTKVEVIANTPYRKPTLAQAIASNPQE